MKTIAVANQKGGSGKTTTAVTVAACLGELGRRVLLVDLDPQASATMWLGAHDAGPELYEVMTGERLLPDVIRGTAFTGVSVVPAHKSLAGVERVLAADGVGADTVLQRALKRVDGFDYVLLDCPPTLGYLTINGLVAADSVVVPVEARVIALAGVGRLLEIVERVGEVRAQGRLRVLGIVACRVSRTRHAREVVDLLRKRYGTAVFETVVRETIRLGEAPAYGPVTVYDSQGPGAVDYRALTREIVKRETTKRK